MSSNLSFEHTDNILIEDRLFVPSEDVVKNANITAYMKSKGFDDYGAFYQWSLTNRFEFWDDMAKELHWFEPWKSTFEWTDKPFFKWFTDGKFNIAYNCLDRYMGTPIQDKVAFYWEGDDGSSRACTYKEMYVLTNRVAKVLQHYGVRKGDRVAIYMPMIPEMVASVLACARLGAPHMVVFGGFAASSLRDRIVDCDAKIIITADGGYRGGKVLELKKIADEAIAETPTIEKVIVQRHTGLEVPMIEGRDTYLDVLLKDVPEDTVVPCEPMDSEDMLYILYTSGSTSKPKGVVHVHGGYAVGCYATTKFVFDIKPSDIFWCTADIGWVTGHSYTIYGPMANAASIVLFEGIPTYPAADRFWSIVEKYKVNIIYTAPTAIRSLIRFGEELPAKHDLSSLRILGTVGEPINPEAWMWYRKNIGRDELPIMDTWWQTETGMILISPTPILPLKPGSASRPLPTIEADVVDRDGKPVGPEHGGFLIIRHPWPAQMRTIFGDPARYLTYWDTIPDVYFAGDAATMDKMGYFRVQGRVDDVIKVSGHRLGSMEIESSLVSHPAVAEAAAIGKPDEVKGEHIKLFAARAGQAFLRSLGPQLGARYRAAYVDHLPLPAPAPVVLDDLDDHGRALVDLLAGRVPDGNALYEELDTALRPATGTASLPQEPAIDPADAGAVTEAAKVWLGWFDAMRPPPRPEAWDPEHLEYRFQVAAPAPAPEAVAEVVLSAPGFGGGHLDWPDLDVATGTDVRAVAYRLATEVPDYWHPLLPVLRSRTLAGVSWDNVALEVGGFHQVQGRLLRQEGAGPRRIAEQEVPRSGAVLSRSWQRARGPDGRVHLWVERRKNVGRGEGSSGLAFDTLAPAPQE